MAGNAPGRPEGGNSLENVRLNAAKRIRVNADFKMPRINVKEIDNTKEKHRCLMCGRTYPKQVGNFPSSGESILWKGNNGYLPFCKSCCESLLLIYTTFYSGNEEHALRHLCTIFDWYYCDIASAMTATQKDNSGKSRVLLYPSKASTRPVTEKGRTFLDTIRDENKTADIIESIADLQEFSSNDDEQGDEYEVTKDVLRKWGSGYTPEQYQYLEEEYADWCTKHVCNTKSQEELFKNIVMAQLNIRIAQQSGYKVSEAMDTLQKLMNSANILPKQTADNILADTQTFGTLVKKYEDTDPIPEPDPRWRDVDNIRKYMNTYFRGGLAKALKINNENAMLYDEAVKEMSKYTVDPTSVDDSDSPGASIFEQSEGGGRSE